MDRCRCREPPHIDYVLLSIRAGWRRLGEHGRRRCWGTGVSPQELDRLRQSGGDAGEAGSAKPRTSLAPRGCIVPATSQRRSVMEFGYFSMPSHSAERAQGRT